LGVVSKRDAIAKSRFLPTSSSNARILMAMGPIFVCYGIDA
jgi:hypothetical protein